MDMVKAMQLSYSYKPVFLLSFLKNMNETGSVKLEDVAKDFAAYYVSAKSKYEPPGGAHDHRTKASRSENS